MTVFKPGWVDEIARKPGKPGEAEEQELRAAGRRPFKLDQFRIGESRSRGSRRAGATKSRESALATTLPPPPEDV